MYDKVNVGCGPVDDFPVKNIAGYNPEFITVWLELPQNIRTVFVKDRNFVPCFMLIELAQYLKAYRSGTAGDQHPLSGGQFA